MSKGSSSSAGPRRPSQIPSQSVIDSSSATCNTAVTKLLVSTKALLEGLSQWSTGQKSDEAISDIYVKLGNDFNDCTRAFSKAGISFHDLMNVPQDLRECLETCLSAEVASPATLEAHLPAIREIIAVMLSGLKEKQRQLRDLSQPSPQATYSPQMSTGRKPSSQSAKENQSRPGQSQTMSVPASAVVPEPEKQRQSADPTVSVSRARSSPASRQPIERAGYATHSRDASLPSSRPPLPPQPTLSKSQSTSAIANRPATPSNLANNLKPGTPSRSSAVPAEATASATAPVPVPPAPALPVLHFEAAPLSDVIPRSASGKGKAVDRDSIGTSSGMASSPSFDALKSSENLARRASKRFSRYTMSTMAASPQSSTSTGMTSSPSRTGLSESASPSRKLHKTPPAHLMPSGPPPPLPTALPAFASDTLQVANQSARKASVSSDTWAAHVRHLDEREGQSELNERARRPSDTWNMYVSQIDATNSTLPRLAEEEDEVTPRLPSLPPLGQSTSSTGSIVKHAQETSDDTVQHEEEEAQQVTGSGISVFLTLGRATKKVLIETDQGPATIASLRLLFMDRFSFSPGHEDFPAIYIRDPRLGVEYELEDMAEVKQDCVLSLNIEPLDQMKQHIDTGFINLSKDLKDLKATMAAVRRASIPPPPPPPRMEVPVSPKTHFTEVIKSPTTATSSQFPMSPFSEKMLSDHKEDIQKVRRELAVLKQIHSDYTSQHKGIITALRSQIEKVKEVAATKVSASRAFIEAGKGQLDSQSEDLLTRVEALMDLVEGVRDDVTIRRVRPLPSRVDQMRKDIAATRTELDDVRAHVASIKPAWKQTWAHELQNVMEEERFLKHQEKMLSEMDEDHRAMTDLFGKIDELVKQPGSLRGSTGRPSQNYVPPEPDESHTGLPTVMAEVQSLAVDPDKRLRAIELAEKQRDKDKLARKGNDVFASELGGFVDGRLLKKTGGAEETERVRRLKSEAQLKQMFDAGRVTALPDSPKGSVSSSSIAGDSRPASAADLLQ